ncbi:hypothetical protein ZIOFF_008009 [Zingiber officinale]|uniref:ATP synthase 24 kDa subunit, mitochondrial n=1 Tax=Zingiber officinale TaxID=94328 RepID=A0A8J5I2X8_ZINOF|nr:hypothetical protein ZIOFF_008009 [Zingiber officinale]
MFGGGASLAEELHSVEELQSVEELGASPRGGDLGLREASRSFTAWRSLELRHVFEELHNVEELGVSPRGVEDELLLVEDGFRASLVEDGFRALLGWRLRVRLAVVMGGGGGRSGDGGGEGRSRAENRIAVEGARESIHSNQSRTRAAAAAMALVSRLLSRSRQLYAGQIFFQHDHGMPVRSYAKEASASNLPPLKGDEMLRNIFYDVKNKFETAFSVLRKEKITIDPDDPAAVSQYAKVIKTIREKADLLSESQKIKYAIDLQTQDIPDARTYLLTLQEIRIKYIILLDAFSAQNGLADDIGAEPLMMEALEKVEKEIKKPLLRSDKKNMSLLLAEFDKVNKKLGIKKEDLPKYEEQLELKVAKEDLDGLKKDAIEAMETQLKREEFKDEELVDVKSLDIRNFF